MEEVVADWLTEAHEEARLDSLTIVDEVIRVDATGVDAAPSIDDTLEVRLTWVERRAVNPEPTPNEIVTKQIEDVARDFAARNDLSLESVTYDGTVALIQLAGERQPAANKLVDRIESLIDQGAIVTVFFVERIDITNATTTAPASVATPIPTTTPNG